MTIARKPILTAKALVLSLALASAAATAVIATPTLHEITDAPSLEQVLPSEFGGWKTLPNPTLQVGLTTGGETSTDQPYDQSVMRSYVDGRGHLIQVAVAWGKKQRQEIKIHRPELCYPAQGLPVKDLKTVTLPVVSPASGEQVVGKRMLAEHRSGQMEAVSYLIRIGSIYSEGAVDTRMHIFKEGLAGRLPDGVLLRVSQVVADKAALDDTYERQEKFMAELVAATPEQARSLLIR